MKNKTIILVLFLIIFTQLANAQKQFNTWYFGDGIGLDFNVSHGNQPNTIIATSIEPFYSNPAVWSNRVDGSVEFYTDGYYVYNSEGDDQEIDISNGNPSYIQSVLIVPKIGAGFENDFYIITAQEPSSGVKGINDIAYTEVNYKDVTSSVSEISSDMLNTNAVGKMAATINRDKDGYWIVTHPQNSNDFEVHLMTETGIYTTTSTVEPTYGNWDTQENLIGFFKFSPSGKYLASTSNKEGMVYIYNFDKNLGELTFNSTYSITAAYGVEFSPNEEFLYVGQYDFAGINNIYQIDVVNGGTPTQIGTAGEPERNIGALQLAPDGKIYVAHTYFGMSPSIYNDFIGIINKPNNAVCNFNRDAIQFEAQSYNVTEVLPSVPSNLVLPKGSLNFSVSGTCAGNISIFTIQDDTGITSVEWYFDDVNNAPNDVSFAMQPSYNFWSGGSHEVTLIAWYESIPQTFTKTITINGPDILGIGTEIGACENITLFSSYNNVIGTPLYTWTNTTTTGTGTNETYYLDNLGENNMVLLLKDDSNCTAHYEEMVFVETPPTLDLESSYTGCDAITITPNVTGEYMDIYWTEETYSQSGYGDEFTFYQTGTYNVIVDVFTESGCGSTYTISVTVNFSPLVNLGNDLYDVCDTTTVIPSVSYVAPITGTDWFVNESPVGSGSSFFLDQPAGTYSVSVVVIDEANCSAEDYIMVKIIDGPTLTFDQDFIACDQLILAPTYSSAVTPMFSWETIPATTSGYTETYTINNPGNYDIQATIDDGICNNTYTISVTVNQSPTLEMLNLIACDSITLSSNNITINGSPDLDFSWYNENTTQAGTDPEFFVDNLGDNLIQLTVTDENDCFGSNNINVFINESPQIDLGADIECVTTPIELSILPDDYQYISWSNGLYDTYTCTVNQPGEYWVEVGTENCITKDTIQIAFAECQAFIADAKINNNPNIDNIFTICDGNKTIDFEAIPNFLNNDLCYNQSDLTSSYYWTMGDGNFFTDKNINHTYSEYGTYNVNLMIVDAENCRTTKRFKIKISQTPFISTTDKVACFEDTLNIVAGQVGGEYADIYIEMYDIVYPFRDTIKEIFELPAGQTTEIPIQIDNGENDFIIQNETDIAGFYVNMEHSNITDFDNIKIQCPNGTKMKLVDLLNIQTPEMPIIMGEPVIMETGYGEGHSYFWSENSNNTIRTIIENETYPQKYYTDPNGYEFGSVGFIPQGIYAPAEGFSKLAGCPINGEWKLIVNDVYMPEDGYVFEWGIAFNSVLHTQLDIDGGGWTGENIIEYINDSIIKIEAITEGNSIYTLSLTDSYGCSYNESINLFTEKIDLELGNDTTLCYNETIELSVADNENFDYNWNTNETSPMIIVSEQGEYTVEVTGLACAKSDTIFIDIAPELNVFLGNDTTICYNQSIEIKPNITDVIYNWNTDETTQSITVSEAGEYWVTINQESCTAQDTIFINIAPELDVFLGNDTTICEGQEINISPETTENVAFNWNTSEQTPSINVTKEGEYWVEISQENCTDIDTIKINVAPALDFEFGDDITIFTGEQITLDVGIEDAIYLWQPTEETTQSINVSEAGMYVVTVTKGCSVSDSITIYINDVQLIIPNTFTPNGDGINETWQFGNAENLGEIEINIFDQLGNIMANYTTTENPIGWDGTRNNNPLPSDTFWYIIKFKGGTTKSGTVTIRR